MLPFGIGRRTEREDRYEGWRIEKGAWVMVNNWAILHDETHFGSNPESFDPDRYLKEGVKDPRALFGFGRR